MKVAVVLVNYKGMAYIRDLFASLSNVAFPHAECDIFFVDNGGADGSLLFAKEHAESLKRRIFFIENEKNVGFAEGNNQALRRILDSGEYRYSVLLNIDTVIEPQWLQELVAAAEENESIGAVQSLILLNRERHRINTSGNKLHYLCFGWSGEYGKDIHAPVFDNRNADIGYASGAAVLFRNEALRKVGVFDETFFMYHEDLELSWRIRLAGFKIIVAPRSIVYHKYEFSRNKNKWYFVERNRLLTFFMMYEWRTIFLFMPVFIFMEFGMLFYSLFSGWWKGKIRSYIGVLSLLWHIGERRRFIKHIRVISDTDAMKYMTSKFEFSLVKKPFLGSFVNMIASLYFVFVQRLLQISMKRI